MKKKLLIGLMLLGINIGLSYGQVLIGVPGVPAEGAILDLKDKSVGADNVSASKGFLMPRVMLTDLMKLTPLVKTETTENKKEHIGLQVYHIGGGASTITPGLKIWNGTQWDEIFSSPKGQWIYMPPFPIDMFRTTEVKIPLYAEYTKQVDKAKTDVSMWKEDEVKFVILGFDSISFTKAPIISMNGTKAELVYTADPSKITAKSYLNIIMVKIK